MKCCKSVCNVRGPQGRRGLSGIGGTQGQQGFQGRSSVYGCDSPVFTPVRLDIPEEGNATYDTPSYTAELSSFVLINPVIQIQITPKQGTRVISGGGEFLDEGIMFGQAEIIGLNEGSIAFRIVLSGEFEEDRPTSFHGVVISCGGPPPSGEQQPLIL